MTFLFICSKLNFEFFQASSDKVGQNIEATITSFKIRALDKDGAVSTCYNF